MAKVTVTTITNLQNEVTAVAAINANFNALKNAMDLALFRDGQTPNTVTATVDMNSNRIINLPLPVQNTEPARLVDIGNAPVSAAAASASATAAATSATNAAASAATASTQASGASGSATAAATSATNAATSATAAAASATTSTTNATVIAGQKFNFETSTTMAAPATGGFRFNNATVASVTALALSAFTADTGNPDIHAFIATWGASSSSTNRATLVVRKLGTPATFAVFSITAAVTDNTTWSQITVSYVTGNGSFSAADALTVQWERTGDAGSGTVAGMTNHGIPLASSATAIGSSLVLTDGQLVVGATGVDPTARNVSGDITLSSTGVSAVAKIAGVTVSGTTGTVNAVFSNSPTLVTPVLGTPASGTLTNCTGLPVAGITASTSTALGIGSLELGHASDTTVSRAAAGVIAVEGVNLTPNLPITSKSAAYTVVLADANTAIYHPSSDNNARTFTIDSNANVAYPVGTALTFINEINTVTIAITSDTLTLQGPGSTGSRTLAANGMATAIKVTSTKWVISGAGLS